MYVVDQIMNFRNFLIKELHVEKLSFRIKSQLATFQVFLRQNPSQHIVFRDAKKELVKWKSEGVSSYRTELVKSHTVTEEKIFDPLEVLITVDKFKELMNLEQFDERTYNLKAVEFQRPGNKTERGYRAPWESWMSGKPGFYQLQRSHATQSRWEFEKGKLCSDQSILTTGFPLPIPTPYVRVL